MLEQDGIVESLARESAMGAVRQNYVGNVGVNPDEEARVQNAAGVLGIPVEQARASQGALDAMLAEQYAGRLDLPPATRKFLADTDRARLVASTPKAYEDLSVPEQVMNLVTSGFKQRTIGNAQEDAFAAVTASPISYYDSEGSDAQGTGETDYSFLKQWAERPDSPLMRDAQERAKRATRELAIANYEAQKIASPKVIEDISHAESFGEAVGLALSHPIDAILGTGIQSAAAMREGLLLTLAGYAVGGPVTGALLAGAMSSDLEYGSSLNQTLQEAGVDVTDANAIREALQNPIIRETALRKAQQRANVVGAFDTLAGLIAPVNLKPMTNVVMATRAARRAMAEGAKREAMSTAVKVSPVLKELDNLFGQALVGGGLGAAGEAGAQIASEGQITSWGDVVLEAFGELASAPVDVLTARASIKRLQTEAVQAERAKQFAAGAKQMLDLSDTNEVAQRAPDAYKQYLREAAVGTVYEKISVNVGNLKRAGVFDAFAKALPSLNSAIAFAEATGGDIDISMGDLFQLHRADATVADTVVSMMRSGPEGMSLEEAESFDAESGANLSKAAERLVTAEAKRVDNAATFKADFDAAFAPIEQGIRASYPDKFEADNLVAASRAIIESMSNRTGMKASELLGLLKKPLTIANGRKKSGARKGGTVLGFFDRKDVRIHINKEGTASTFLHEMAHYWLEAVTKAVATGELSFIDPTYEKSWAEMLTWLGAKGDSLTELATDLQTSDKWRDMHEKFAEGFEAYLRDGKAPREGLEAVFEAFKEFVRRFVAYAPSATREKLPPEVIALYDDLFFSDAQASEGVETAGGVSDAMDAVMKGALTPVEYEAYKGMYTASVGEASAKINAVHARNRKLINSARERANRGLTKAYDAEIDKATKEILDRKEYQTLDIFKGGASHRADGLKAKMSDDAAKLQLTREAYDYAKKKGWIRKTGDNLISPKDLSELLDYSSAQAMVEDAILANETDVKAEAKKIADQRFLEKYGEAATERGRQRLATNAAYNRARLLIIAAEFRALKGLVGNVRNLARAAEAFAHEALGRVRVSGVRASSYEAAARRARRDRDRALAKGDTDTAAELTRAEMMNTALAREAGEFADRFKRFLRSVPRVVESKRMAFRYRDQYRAIVAAYGIMDPAKARPNKNAPSITEFFNQVSSDPYIAHLWAAAPQFLREGKTMRVTDMSVADASALISFLNMLASAGRKVGAQERADIKAGEVSERMRLTGELKANAEARGRSARFEASETRPWLKRKEALVGFFQDHVKMSTWARIFDGNKFGPWFDLIIKRANACADKERVWQKQVNDKLEALLDPLIKKGLHTHDVEINGVRYTLGMRLAIALNMGNEVNLARLRNGNNLSEVDLQAIISTLTADELATVQEIWNLFDSFRPEIDAMQRRIYGETLEWTQPVPLTVTSSDNVAVTLKGGYYPIRYDTQSKRGQGTRQAQLIEDETKKALEGGFTGTTTSRTYTKSRTRDGLNVPLRLDIDPLFDAVTEVIHDVCWREQLMRLARLGNGIEVTVDDPEGGGAKTVYVPGLREAMSEYYGPTVGANYNKWLTTIAYGNRAPQNTADKYTTLLRRGVSIAGLGFNVVSAIVQITGLIPAVTRVGVGGLYSACTQYFQNPKRAAVSIAAKSDFMKVRTDTFLRELDDLRGRIQTTSRTGRALIKVQDSAYVFMTFVQNHVDRITWMAAYEQAAKEGLSEADCIARADQTVRDTQGSGLISDQSAIEVGPVAKLFTAFYSFMNTAYNLNAAALLGEKDRHKAAADMLVVSLVMPLVEGVLRAALQPGEDDDEDKEFVDYARQAAGLVVSHNLGMLVWVREGANAAGNFISGEPVYTWRGPSSLRTLSDIGQVLSQAQQGEFDAALMKALINATGSVLGLPAAQGVRFVDGWEALVVDEKTSNPFVLVTGYKD